MKYTIGTDHNGEGKSKVFVVAISLCLHGVMFYFLSLVLMNKPLINKDKNNLSVAVKFSSPTKKIELLPIENISAKNFPTPSLEKIPSKKTKLLDKQKVILAAAGNNGVSSPPSEEILLGKKDALGNHGIENRSRPLLINAHDIKIPYPEQARARHVEGIVRMKLTVAESGKVIDVDVISGPAHGLRQAALMVARKLFFLPATDEYGHAQVAHIEHEVIFRLKKSS
jgi:TonB family protein